MESNIKLTNPSPKTRAGVFSQLTFCWLFQLFRKCVKNGLNVCDLYDNIPEDKSEKLCNLLEKNWNEELAKTHHKPSLLRAIRKTFFWSFMLRGITTFFYTAIIRSFLPWLLSSFIGLFSKSDVQTMPYNKNINAMCAYGGLLIITSFAFAFQNHENLALSQIGMRVRIACCSLIYRKTLRLSKKSLSESASGKIINLLSNDVSRFDMLTPFIHFLWITPIQIPIITWLVWDQVGTSAFIGVIVLIFLTMPLYIFSAKLSFILRLKVAIKTDVRVKKMAEIISGIQVIKMYAWEKPFAKVVNFARAKEIGIIAWRSYIQGIIHVAVIPIEKIALGVTIVTYVFFGNVITAEKMFSVILCYQVLQVNLAICFPIALTMGTEVLASIKRLEEFLLLEERNVSIVQLNSCKSVILTNVSASAWNQKTHLFDNINIRVSPGSLCAIIGPVGSGKSTIFQLLLGELIPKRGTIEIGGNISYSSQEPWLFSSTIRNNILFGQQYDRERYEKVIKSCAMERDLGALPQGDLTLVGEKGSILSGGQKARINLARAVYRNADIYLLDDPLSAVDMLVGNCLFEECILGFLKNKTRILVTHQLQYLQKADHLVVMNNGKVEAQGTFDDLTNSNLDFTKLLIKSKEDIEQFEHSTPNKESEACSPYTKEIPLTTGDVGNKEEISSSKIRLLAYWEYIRATGNVFRLIALIFFILLTQVLLSAIDFWGTYWTKNESCRSVYKTSLITNEVTPTVDFSLIRNEDYNRSNYWYKTDNGTDTQMCDDGISTNSSVYIYIGFIISFLVVSVVKGVYFVQLAMTASRNVHDKMFYSLLQVPMRFFDINQSGRILNRFSSDIGLIDEVLPGLMLHSLSLTLYTIGVLIMVFIMNLYMVILAVALGIIIYKVQTWHFRIAGNLKHLEGISRSPVFTHVNESLTGLTTIRASSTESILVQEFDWHQDTHTSAWYTMLACTASFSWIMDIVSAIFIGVVIFSFVIMEQYTTVNGSVVGLAVSQSLLLIGMVQFGIKQIAEVISKMASVERVLEYTMLDKEGPQKSTIDEKSLANWPSVGAIKFHQIYLRYSEHGEQILKNVNFTVKGGEKVGIVGRTGAGKSSLIAALFRLVPADEGFITVDDVRTDIVGLNDLRKRISIIPQDPILFAGTVRYNLDPFEEYSDKELWNALDTVELKDVLDTLEYEVKETGSNFSIGQRQLICLARAVLRRNKILVLDEATANVDPKTDALIQKTIRRKFSKCTVLTIAHRLHTVMDSDQILVMDGGEVVEFDTPYQLLQNKNGHLHKMVAQTGSEMGKLLYQLAEYAFIISKGENADSTDF